MSARLFVALELPEEVSEALLRWRESTLDGAGQWLRPVSPQNLHITLCFLGAQPEAAIPAIQTACASVGGLEAPELAPEAGLWLPSASRPRVLAVRLSVSGGHLETLQRTLSGNLAAGGWYLPERRAFLPHVTVARVSGRARVRGQRLPGVPEAQGCGRTVTLFRSRLGAGGARYEPLASVRLSPSADDRRAAS